MPTVTFDHATLRMIRAKHLSSMTPGCGNNNSATLVVYRRNVIRKKSRLKYSRIVQIYFHQKPWRMQRERFCMDKVLSLN